MNESVTPDGPSVFLSYAGPDRAEAERLAADLDARGIAVFFAPGAIAPGVGVPVALSHALRDSDYFVLLVSAASIDRPWVELEWSAALEREMRERRVFVFLLCLDNTPPPEILAPRLSLDALADWDGAVDRLVATWRRDLGRGAKGIQVLPAPEPAGEAQERGETIDLYVFNRDLGVEHFLRSPQALTGRQLFARVKSSLMLQDRVETLRGKVGLAFEYRLEHAGRLLDDVVPITAAGVGDGSSLDLLVTMTPFGPCGPTEAVAFRAVEHSRGLPPRIQLDLLRRAFAHLLPSTSPPDGGERS